MLADDDSNRKTVIEIIESIRHKAIEEDSMREFKRPIIDLSVENLKDLPLEYTTEPPLTKTLSLEQIRAFSAVPFVVRIPCHSQV